MAEIKTVSCPVCGASFTFENWSKVEEQIEQEMEQHLKHHTKEELIKALMTRYRTVNSLANKSS